MGLGTNKRSVFALTFVIFIAIIFSHALSSLLVLLMVLTTYLATTLFARSEAGRTKSIFGFSLLATITVLAYNMFVSSTFLNDAVLKVTDALKAT